MRIAMCPVHFKVDSYSDLEIMIDGPMVRPILYNSILAQLRSAMGALQDV